MKHTLPRAWDEFDGYLFDIDGTLIHCTDATHYFAFCHVLKHLSNRDLNLDGVMAHGNVDVGIVRDALARAGVPDDDWRGRIPEMREMLSDFVEARKDELCTTVLPQVRDVLEQLKNKGARLAVATGNLERIGRLKLERAGLLAYFDFGGWSDLHETRSAVFEAAVMKAREFCGRDAALCVVGDTPSDIRAAHDNGLPVIAVATGIYPFEQLVEEKPEMCIRSFAELLPAGSDLRPTRLV